MNDAVVAVDRVGGMREYRTIFVDSFWFHVALLFMYRVELRSDSQSDSSFLTTMDELCAMECGAKSKTVLFMIIWGGYILCEVQGRNYMAGSFVMQFRRK